MKTIQLILGLMIISTFLKAQVFEMDIANIKKVEIHDIYGELIIDGRNNKQITVKLVGENEICSGIKNHQPAEYKADNTQLGLNISVIGDVLNVCVSSEQAQFNNYRIQLPKNVNVIVKNKFASFVNRNTDEHKSHVRDLQVKGMKSEIDINVFASNLILTNIKGPLLASVYMGKCNASFERFNKENPSAITVMEGDVLVNFEYSANAHVILKSGKGEIKTNFPFRKATITNNNQTFTKKNFAAKTSKKNKYSLIEGDINKGGNQITVNSLNGKVEFYQYGNPVYLPPVMVAP
jgi:hypothetical protein